MRRIHTLCAIAGTAALTAVTPPAQAAVPVICDANALVTAIGTANSGGGTLDLAPHCTYKLTSAASGDDGLPPINATIVINGNNATITRAAGSPHFRIFDVTSSGNLTLNNLTVSNGNAVGGSAPLFSSGGGIFDAGVLSLYNTTVRGNTAGADGGGGIRTAGGGSATITYSRISGNTTSGYGGGLATEGSSAILDDSLISGNKAGAGAGIGNAFSSLTISGGDVRGNTAESYGGGIANAFGSVRGVRTVIRTNAVTGAGSGDFSGGGGVFNSNGGTFRLSDSGVNGNSANTPGVKGGGIKNFAAVELNRTAVRSNSSGAAPGGIFNANAPFSSVTLHESPVTKNRPTNCAGSPGSVPGCFGH